jgi:hypothetical protein
MGLSILIFNRGFRWLTRSLHASDLAKLFSIAFDDFSQYLDREWWFMAWFMIELALQGIA